MRIVDDIAKAVNASDIPVGEGLRYDGRLCMRIQDEETVDPYYPIQVVDLASAGLELLAAHAVVRPVDIEVRVTH